MGAVKKYCNKAVLIEDGLIKAIGNPDDVANQYSFDNAIQPTQEKAAASENKTKQVALVENFEVKLLSPNQVTPDDELKFEFTFTQLQDIETHIAMSFVDINTNYGYYNDNSMDLKISGTGEKESHLYMQTSLFKSCSFKIGSNHS